MHYVYMIRCEDGSFYTGYSTDPERRFKEHLSGKGAKYTRSHKPVELVMQCLCMDKSAALKLEARIKNLSHEEKVILLREYKKLDGENIEERV